VTGRRTFILRLEDDPGALNRVVSVLRQRSLNISSLSVAPCESPGSSRLTLVAEAGMAPRLEQRLRKEVPVLEAEEVTDRSTVQRELALLRVRVEPAQGWSAVADVATRFGGAVVSAAGDSVIVEIAGPSATVDCLATALRPFGILELARSGPVAMVHEEHPRPRRADEETSEE
jgi:acetolactate synthase I/III small subunit